MTVQLFAIFVVTALVVTLSSALSDEELCLGTCTGTAENEVCVFKFSVNIFAGHSGYFAVEGCAGIQPTLGMKHNVTYIFDQTNETNWFHPLGFAYGPDGVYSDNAELEKVSGNPISELDCGLNSSVVCDFPQYKLNNVNLCTDPGDCEEDFGLDEYEGVFFSGSRDTWLESGNFTVELKVTDPATTEIFYFCHIHNKMSGRIKILDSNNHQIDPEDKVEIPYTYTEHSEFDEICGTTNISQYADLSLCPGMTFLCGPTADTFAQCMNAIDCAMHVEMRVTVGHLDPVATFMHQMIAHHRNAVNMAKIVLKLNPDSLACGTTYDGRRLSEGCAESNSDGNTPAVTLLWDIVNVQNQQITLMESWLEDNLFPPFDNCPAKADKSTLDATLISGVALSSFGVALIVAFAGIVLYRAKLAKRSIEAAPSKS